MCGAAWLMRLVIASVEQMLDLIGQVLTERGWSYYRIDGNMSKTEDRQHVRPPTKLPIMRALADTFSLSGTAAAAGHVQRQ